MMNDILYWLIRMTLGPLVRMIWVARVEGLENIPRSGAVICALSHESYFDFITFIAVCPRPVHFLAAEKFFKRPFSRFVMRITGQIKVERTSKDKASVHSAVREMLDRGGLIGIFPEGTRAPTPDVLLHGFTGVARYAMDSRSPIVPVGIKHAFEVMSRHDHKPRYKKIIEIYVGDAIRPDAFAHLASSEDGQRRLTDHVMHRISRLCGKPYPYVPFTDTL